MTERERLVELIRNSTQHCLKCGCEFFDNVCKYGSEEQCQEKLIADYLLANGVVVLPCNKDELYSIKTHYKSDKKDLYAIIEYFCRKNKPKKIAKYRIIGKELIENKDIKCFEWLPSSNFKVLQDGFFTKEEAEKKLKELNKE